MGAYLMKPNVNKESTDEDNQHLSYGASSMQGWRCEQEDAHNSILDFDLNAAFFAVYDGHGGSEVAQYCAKYLPEFLKKLDEYKSGEYEEALRQLFLKFDAFLLTPEAQAELSALRKSANGMSSVNGDELEVTDVKSEENESGDGQAVEESEEEDEKNEAAALYDEACMPLEEVLKRYTNTEDKVRKMLKKKGLVRAGPSPMINAPKSSQKSVQESGLARRNLDSEVNNADQHDFLEPQVPDFAKQEELDISEIKKNSKADLILSSANPHEQDYDEASNLGDVTDSQRSTSVCDQSSIQSNDTLSKSQLVNSSTLESVTTITKTASVTIGEQVVSETITKTTNKHILLAVEEPPLNPDTPSKLKMNQEEIKLSPIQKKSLNYSSIIENSQNSTSIAKDEEEEQPQGESTTVVSLKPDNKAEEEEEEEEEENETETVANVASNKKKMTVRELYKSDLFTKFVNSCVNAKLKQGLKASSSKKSEDAADNEEEDDDEFDDDSEEDSSEEDDDDDDEEEEEEEDDEEEKGEEEEDDEDEPESLEEFLLQQSAKTGGYRDPRPGFDSGCTAVVALLLDKKHLYVANAGDSRCIVCRKGKSIDMSIDHKPEDDLERQRIEKAGGVVTKDGRVNYGLNLSRAIGDHSYKQTEGLSLSEQMITSLPDIVHLEIDPEQDEFMVLACDGIWNFMSSQEVCDYVSVRLQGARNYERLSQICEELFMHCLAPDADGDGTGCDNMTCVIITFTPFPMIVGATSSGCLVSQTLKASQQDQTATTVEQKLNLKRMLDNSNGAKLRSGDDTVSTTTNANAPSDRTNLVDNNRPSQMMDGETESKKLKSDHNGSCFNGNHVSQY